MESYEIALLTGSFTLAGSILTLIASTIKDYLNNKNNIMLEKMKIFVGNQFDAYNELLLFMYDIIPLWIQRKV